MKELNPRFVRKPEEIEKFKYLIQTLVWIQGKTGKSYADIVSRTLRRGKTMIDLHCYY